jgi:hypothetical protein
MSKVLIVSGGMQKQVAPTDKIDVQNLDAFTVSSAGIVPSPAGDGTKFLKSDGTWATASGGGVTLGKVIAIQMCL